MDEATLIVLPMLFFRVKNQTCGRLSQLLLGNTKFPFGCFDIKQQNKHSHTTLNLGDC